ncbi:MAG: hypothetical protein IJ272_01275 [Clostridia bacterium]|nr:hypothetical protein [Clostridia bacterium]
MDNEFAYAAAEVRQILNYLPKEDTDKIPLELIEFLKNEADENYVSNIDPHKQLNEQKITEKAKDILTYIYREYWCNEQRKKELDEVLLKNEKIEQQIIQQSQIAFNADIVFGSKEKQEVLQEVSKHLVNYENKNFLIKILEKIKYIFKRRAK